MSLLILDFHDIRQVEKVLENELFSRNRDYFTDLFFYYLIPDIIAFGGKMKAVRSEQIFFGPAVAFEEAFIGINEICILVF